MRPLQGAGGRSRRGALACEFPHGSKPRRRPARETSRMSRVGGRADLVKLKRTPGDAGACGRVVSHLPPPDAILTPADVAVCLGGGFPREGRRSWPSARAGGSVLREVGRRWRILGSVGDGACLIMAWKEEPPKSGRWRNQIYLLDQGSQSSSRSAARRPKPARTKRYAGKSWRSRGRSAADKCRASRASAVTSTRRTRRRPCAPHRGSCGSRGSFQLAKFMGDAEAHGYRRTHDRRLQGAPPGGRGEERKVNLELAALSAVLSYRAVDQVPAAKPRLAKFTIYRWPLQVRRHVLPSWARRWSSILAATCGGML